MLIGRSSMRSGLLANEGGVPSSTGLDAALQRSWIDGDEAKVEPVAACPLKVIQQGPGEVATDGNPTFAHPRECLDMAAQIGDTLFVVYLARWHSHLVEGRTVLGHEECARMIHGV